MNKIIGMGAFLFVLLVICLCAGNYLGGYAALKYSGVDMAALQWGTFQEVISGLSGQEQYKKLIAVSWAGFAAPLVVFVGFVMIVIVGLMPKKVIYGNARLATDMDLSKSTFFPSPDVVNKAIEKADKPFCFPPILIGKMFKGRYKNQYVYFYGQQFLILYAPTRSGKGVGIVIPNCTNYPDSMVVLDIKLENWFMSAGYRTTKLKQDCYLFAPAGYANNQAEALQGLIKSHRWNPLDCVGRSDLQRESDLDKVASILMPAEGSDPFWSDAAKGLFMGLGLYLLDKERFQLKNADYDDPNLMVPPVLFSLAAILKLSVPDTGKDLASWMGAAIEKESFISDKTKFYFRSFMAAPDKTRGSILTNFSSYLKIFNNPITAEATNSSDFDIRDVRKKRMSIYLGLTPDALVTHGKLVNLFFSMLVNENTRELPEQNPDLKYQCLILCDEFTSMGKSEIIEKSVAFTAGYNLRWMFILQNEGQGKKDDMYGEHGWEAFVENSAVVLYYPPKAKNELTKKISEEIGVMDMKVTKKSDSRSGGKGGTSRSRNHEIVERPVLLPEEINALRDVKNKAKNIAVREIIMSEFTRPFIANKIIWFEEDEFKKRVAIAKENTVDIPVLFTDKKTVDAIKEQAKLYGAKMMANVITTPDLETHDKTDVSE
ncbi:type IV secretory system conjugative DNA transfer family protein (plasmid) [Edwardsiella tarda]|uniref:type IV secretory system conjugative DNA transfer family protein n=1 Tax=Edwardsiella tarda TaxID=636 RepID=UPI000D50EE6E|nr:type IV secretory system conjugative DNA transfer family protein [Edwardsiella tarda]UCQ29604.1 type IV secretory system conjugative DNA transfer family protein [Edwardsiella tarda]